MREMERVSYPISLKWFERIVSQTTLQSLKTEADAASSDNVTIAVLSSGS
jgi:hypothetical protein